MRTLRSAAVVGLLSVATFAYFIAASSVLDGGDPTTIGSSVPSRRLQASSTEPVDEEVAHAVHHRKWTGKHTAALILSVLVSLTSSLDRECGASLYLVLFAVLLNMSFRKAAAMTAFTVALGALGPGIASMSEPRQTERGVLPVVDYPGTLILLPCMFWGISFGAIVNLWFPNWLLALLWVAAMTASNVELLVSFIKYLRVKQEASSIGRQLRLLSPPASGAGSAGAAAAAGSVEVAGMSRAEVVRQQGDLLTRAQKLAKRAHRIEARALLYPVLYVPDVGKALEKAKIEPNPCGLRATATPSCLGRMDTEQEALAAELRSYQTVFGRFTFTWKKWWALNRFHFEMSLVLKIVVLHLVTEAVRHHLSKPCSTRFWIMVFGMTGLVTAMLLFTVTCYTRRRLWRGPHWVDALNQVRAITKQRQEQELQELQTLAGKSSAPTSPTAAVNGGSKAVTAASAAVAAGDALAVELVGSSGGSDDGAAAVVADAAAAAGAQPPPQQQPEQQQQQQKTRWQRFKQRTPWVWVTAPEALSNISHCNSTNQYKNWTIPRILLHAAISLPIGTFGCALGLPGGPMMAHQLLHLGLKPEVVAGTSRFLVMCFTFGSFVAHNIAGGLDFTLAAAFGLLNLGLAPLGMFLVARRQPRGVYVIALSLFMGLAGLVIVAVWQFVPLFAAFVAAKTGQEFGHGRGIRASLMQAGNVFRLERFCRRDGH